MKRALLHIETNSKAVVSRYKDEGLKPAGQEILKAYFRSLVAIADYAIEKKLRR